MVRYIAARAGWGIATVLAIIVLNFLVLHLVPGDPIQALIGDYPAPPDYVAHIRQAFGMDQPLLTQLWLYLVNLAQFNLGFSFANRQPVLDLLLERAPLTLLLMLPALTLAALIGVALALSAAPRAGTPIDAGIAVVSLFGYSVPIFWLGQLLVIVFSIHLGWLPVQGMESSRRQLTGFPAVLDVMWHLVLPLVSVTIYYVAVVSRVSRTAVIDALAQDFVMTARAKGLSEREILWRHVLPNACVPVITVIGYNFGHTLTGAILTEAVFAWPGLGSAFMAAIGSRDYPTLQGIFLLAAVAVVGSNLITDLLTAVADPRVRASYRLTSV
jgi:ABC-type dipeptide/oligopeptide/nickel transport system permease component